MKWKVPNLAKYLTTSILSILCVGNVSANNNEVDMKSTAFYYATNPPVDLFSQFERVILESHNIKREELAALKKDGAEAYAYVSIGEVSSTRSWYDEIQKSWVLGRNDVWDSDVIDLTNPGWKQFIIERLVEPLVEQGYDGLFLDTMDSFMIYSATEEIKNNQAEALKDIITSIHKRWPNLKLIANRGFEVIPYIADQLEAVVAESLFHAWDNSKKVYHAVKPQDTEWLTNKLTTIQQDHNLGIIIIDYIEPIKSAEAQELVDKIARLGFVPWISNPALDQVGLSLTLPINKNYLLIYDSMQDGTEPLKKPVYQWLNDYISKKDGVLKLHDIRSGFPSDAVLKRYMGILTTVSEDDRDEPYKAWLKRLAEKGIHVGALSVEN